MSKGDNPRPVDKKKFDTLLPLEEVQFADQVDLFEDECDIPPAKSLKTDYKKRDSLDCYEYIESMDFSNVLTPQQKYYLNKDIDDDVLSIKSKLHNDYIHNNKCLFIEMATNFLYHGNVLYDDIYISKGEKRRMRMAKWLKKRNIKVA